MGDRCIVTGVAGFIGSWLAEHLIENGAEVIGIDAFIDYYSVEAKRRNLTKLLASERFSLLEASLLDLDLQLVLKDVSHVFHQAGQPGVRASWGTEFYRYIQDNVLATQRLLEAAKSSDIKRLVYASSSSIYGDVNELPISELVTPHPVSPYGVTKLAAEHLCHLYWRNFGVPTVSLRYFTVYGPRQRPDMAFRLLCLLSALIGERSHG